MSESEKNKKRVRNCLVLAVSFCWKESRTDFVAAKLFYPARRLFRVVLIYFTSKICATCDLEAAPSYDERSSFFPFLFLLQNSNFDDRGGGKHRNTTERQPATRVRVKSNDHNNKESHLGSFYW